MVARSRRDGNNHPGDKGAEQAQGREEQIGVRQRGEGRSHEGPAREQHAVAPHADTVGAQIPSRTRDNERSAPS